MSTPPDLAELEPSAVEDAALAEQCGRVLDWTRLNMPLLRGLRDRFRAERPLESRRIGMCLHVEAKTAALVEVLRAGGLSVLVVDERQLGMGLDQSQHRLDHVRPVSTEDP